MGPDSSTAPSGARRSRRAREAILTAAWDLFAETGLPRLSVEAIAERAGVAKTTVYRWWPSKAAVLMDSLGEQLGPQVEFAHSADVLRDLRDQLAAVVDLLTTSTVGDAYLALVTESRHDPDLARELRERYIADRRAAATAVLDRGVTDGQLRADLDTSLMIDTLYGAIYYRLLVQHTPPDANYVDRLLEQLHPTLAGP